jgi:hypothetical protein
VLHEEWIQRDPVPLGHHLPKTGLGLFGGARAHDAQPIRDPVNVRVDRDRGDPVPEHQNTVRRLRANVRKAEQLLHRPRYHSPEPVEDLGRAVAYGPRFRVVEPGPSDQRFDRADRGGGEPCGVGVLLEQPGARDVGRLVARPLREDRSDQHLERILGVVAEVRHAPIAPVVEVRETVHDRLPVEVGRRAHRVPPVPGRVVDEPGYAPVPGSERSGSSGAPWAARISSPTR